MNISMGTWNELPPRARMCEAFLAGDASFNGVFVTAVRTTGIFCLPSCPARKPKPENVEFFAGAREALLAGYRPCKRCCPMDPPGAPPKWLAPLMEDIERDPCRRWRADDLRARGLQPDRVRRWFQQHHGMTFTAYQRVRRLGHALGRIRHGGELADAAFEHGYESLSGFNDAFKQLFGTAPGRARDSQRVVVNRVLSPLGALLAAATDDALVLLEFCDRRMLETQLRTLERRLRCTMVPGENDVIATVDRELAEYFDGARTTFTTPMSAPGTDFQRAVWDALCEIPAGTTVSYGDVARRIGRPASVRAVGRAVGDNRLAILIPCHRVVGSDGKLTGYGGGIWRKQRLLEIESD